MKKVIILVIALAVAFGITIPKLVSMCKIKGWIPGANISQETVTQKWNETIVENFRTQETYWVAWTNEDIRNVGQHRINVPPEKWNQIEIGDQIEIIRLKNRRWPYLRDGIFVSAGNFAFDIALLTVEFAVVFVMLFLLVFRRRSQVLPETALDGSGSQVGKPGRTKHRWF